MTNPNRRDVLGLLAAGVASACGGTERSDDPDRGADAAIGRDGRVADAAIGRDGRVADAASDRAVPDAHVDAHPDAMADAAPDAAPDAARVCEPTRPDAVGPFYEDGAPSRMDLSVGEAGARIRIEGVVRGPDCAPLGGATLDVWQADADGVYHDAPADWRLRGRLVADNEGRFALTTIRPGNYRLGGSFRPAHIHFTVSRPGFASITTQLYFAGDPYLAPEDPCTDTCDSGDPARIVALSGDPIPSARFEVSLASA